MFCKAPTFKLSHLLPETFCKHAEAKWSSSFLLPSQQVAWPTAIWQSGPQGQDSSLRPLMALKKTVAKWDTGVHVPALGPVRSEKEQEREKHASSTYYMAGKS